MHGLRTTNETFFHWNLELLGLGRQIEQKNSEAFRVVSAELSVPYLVQWVPCSYSYLFSHYLKKRLYIHITNIYLGLGFQFGIRLLAFVCLQSVCTCKPPTFNKVRQVNWKKASDIQESVFFQVRQIGDCWHKLLFLSCYRYRQKQCYHITGHQ